VQVLEDAAQHEARASEQAALRERLRLVSHLSTLGVAPGLLLPLLQPATAAAGPRPASAAVLLDPTSLLGLGLAGGASTQPQVQAPALGSPASAAAASAAIASGRGSFPAPCLLGACGSWQPPAAGVQSTSSPPSLSALNHPHASRPGAAGAAPRASSAPTCSARPSSPSRHVTIAGFSAAPPGFSPSPSPSAASPSSLDPVTAAPSRTSLLTAGFRGAHAHPHPHPIGRKASWDDFAADAQRRAEDGSASACFPFPASLSAASTPTAAGGHVPGPFGRPAAAAGAEEGCPAAEAALCSEQPVLASLHALEESGEGAAALLEECLGAGGMSDPLCLRSEFAHGRSAFVAPARSASLLAACGGGDSGARLAGVLDCLPDEL
jgi:hypothetical protein